ncbi:MAG: membrane integrity-associated transporter subunit PqiC [Magnetococcales bacterium]|nr:membrane integrity-associated transporter subunit PqiC [Magnetococcales bacterium]
MKCESRMIAVSLVFLLGLSGCTGALRGESSPPRYFMIAPQAQPANTSTESGPSIQIIEVQVPGYLDRQPIVVRNEPHELRFTEFNLWGEKLSETLTRVLMENIAVQAQAKRVSVYPGPLAEKWDYLVDVSLIRFEQSADNQVTLTARWRLGKGGDPHGASLMSGRYEQSEPIDNSDRFLGSVQALSRVFAGMSATIADAIRQYQSAQ